jgi:phospholipid/cholesterol/gamma-HCH transport system ATP-binding protein
MPDAPPVIQIKQLSYRVNDTPILDRVSLEVRKGEIFAVLGLSGTGKTTLLRLISGLIRPDAGSILVDGRDITRMTEAEIIDVRRTVGFVFQYGALFDSLTVLENVGFWLFEHTTLPESEIREAVAERLAQVGLPGIEGRMPAELSGGMAKRVGIARALVGSPNVLLYDEPTSGLDPVIAATIDELIVQLRDRLGVTEVVVSHDIRSILDMADRLALLYEGRLRLVGTPDDFRQSTDPVVRQFLEGRTDGPIQVV